MWPLCCPRTTSSSAAVSTTTAAAAMKIEGKSVSAVVSDAGGGRRRSTSSTRCGCCFLVTRLMRKLQRRRRSSRSLRCSSRQGSMQCRYDPLSYSLNFDDGRSGSFGVLDEEDYYKFYAFSSRFAANPRVSSSSSSCSVVPVSAGSPH